MRKGRIMLEFRQDYFKEESRDGFVVSEKMKRVWAAELEVLSEIIRICQKHGLTYYADWGTLLGAVRHAGFVPWDDNIDIALKRADYQVLLETLSEELPDSWSVSSYCVLGKHSQPVSCVMNSKVINMDPEVIKRFHGCPYMVGVNLYPLDYIPEDETMTDAQLEMYQTVYDTARQYSQLREKGQLEFYLSKIERLCQISFDSDKPLRKQLWQLSEQICTLFEEEDCDYLTWFPQLIHGNEPFRLKKKWYAETIELPFENISISVPKGYQEALSMMYGDYLVPVRNTDKQDYPFYKKQDEYLRALGRLP